MPQEYFYPISSATHDLPAGTDTWTNSGGANKNASTRPGGGRSGPITNDDDTTRIEKGAAYGTQCLNIDWPGPIGVWSGVLTGYGRHAANVAGTTGRSLAFMNAAGVAGATTFFNLTQSAYTSSGVDASNGTNYRPGGGSWSAVDFQDDKTIFFAAAVTGTLANTQKLTSAYGEISYQPPSGGFIFLLGLAGASALPFIGPLHDILQFKKYLSWRRINHLRRTIMTGEEILTAWDEIKAYRYPTYFHMGGLSGEYQF